MIPEKACSTCELYFHCQHYGELPPEETGCQNWEIAASLLMGLSDEEIEDFIQENPEYNFPRFF